jgi:hypothetical protein
MRTATTLLFLIIALTAASQPGWSEGEFRAMELREELKKNPHDQKLILELALVSEDIDEIKAGRKMDNENLGAVSCHLAEVEMRLEHHGGFSNRTLLSTAHRIVSSHTSYSTRTT